MGIIRLFIGNLISQEPPVIPEGNFGFGAGLSIRWGDVDFAEQAWLPFGQIRLPGGSLKLAVQGEVFFGFCGSGIVFGDAQVLLRGPDDRRFMRNGGEKRRMWLLNDGGPQTHLIEMEMLAMVRKWLACPKALDDVQGFVETLVDLLWRQASALPFHAARTFANAHIQSPMRQVVKHSQLSSQLGRMMQGQHVNHVAQAQALGALCQRGHKKIGAGEMAPLA